MNEIKIVQKWKSPECVHLSLVNGKLLCSLRGVSLCGWESVKHIQNISILFIELGLSRNLKRVVFWLCTLLLTGRDEILTNKDHHWFDPLLLKREIIEGGFSTGSWTARRTRECNSNKKKNKSAWEQVLRLFKLLTPIGLCPVTNKMANCTAAFGNTLNQRTIPLPTGMLSLTLGSSSSGSKLDLWATRMPETAAPMRIIRC